MARPKNPDNTYLLTCKITGAKRKTNPDQFRDMCELYGLTPEEMRNNFVSAGMDGGRRALEREGLNAQQAIEKYGLHPNVANKLRSLNPVVKVRKVKAVDAVDTTQVDAPVTTETENVATLQEA